MYPSQNKESVLWQKNYQIYATRGPETNEMFRWPSIVSETQMALYVKHNIQDSQRVLRWILDLFVFDVLMELCNGDMAHLLLTIFAYTNFIACNDNEDL